ncbi:MAG: hypothetical protein ACR2JC_09850 [Chloroflexota bacterium]|nr:MAG: hypothetical protein DLM70_12500 [Chloroflexota bacterium]
MKHRARCRDCKQTVYRLLGQIFGSVEPAWAPPWPCRPEALVKDSLVGPLVEQIYEALVSHRGFTSFIGRSAMPNCDFFVPGNPGFVVEIDEKQHFAEPRLITLNLIPDGYKLGFDVNRWRQECLRVRAHDNDPPYRDEQRAWYDVLRDLMPPSRGMAGTVRIMDGSFPFCGIHPGDSAAVEAFKHLVVPVAGIQ